jgi:hypothetical protein
MHHAQRLSRDAELSVKVSFQLPFELDSKSLKVDEQRVVPNGPNASLKAIICYVVAVEGLLPQVKKSRAI